jgi:uncharacterized protein (TIGR02757 family)
MASSFNLDPNTLKDFLNHKAQEFENATFISADPISLAHRFEKKEDIEIIGFLMATIAWGQRKSIIQSGEKLLSILGNEPHLYVLEYQDGTCPNFTHRTFNQIDLNGFLLGLKACYQEGNLEYAFRTNVPDAGIFEHIQAFRQRFIPYLEPRTLKHVANPAQGSAAKRLVMFLRWMVRSKRGGVDFGLWKSISPDKLMIPLDVHTGNVARKLGLLQRKQNDWQANEELIAALKEFDPLDPAKYDFALFGLGAIDNF